MAGGQLKRKRVTTTPASESLRQSRKRPKKEAVKESLCAFCRRIPFDRLFQSSHPRRRGRHTIQRPPARALSRKSCHLCKFFDDLESLLSSIRGSEHLEVSISTGRSSFYLSPISTENPWWYTIGLETSATAAQHVWFEDDDASSHLELGRPLIAVTLVSIPPTTPKLTPRERSLSESSTGHIGPASIKSWLRICEEHHLDSCTRAPHDIATIRGLRLIDVQQRSVVAGDQDSRYAALSYVWGDTSRNELLRHVPSSASNKLPPQLPATFEDAIVLVKAVGARYLWIDLFCIPQNDPAAREAQIHQMNLVYRHASFTIIARDSEDAFSGIYGVSKSLKYTTQPSCEIPQGHLMGTALSSIGADLGVNQWQNRAWTLQELVFSRRPIFFTSCMVWMECRKECFHDLMPTDPTTTRKPVHVLNQIKEHSHTVSDASWESQKYFDKYSNLVEMYTRRLLSEPGDILNAFQGVLAEYERITRMTFSFGLPVHDSHRALLWTAHPAYTLTRRAWFPTWSWSGWFGQAHYRQWICDLPHTSHIRANSLKNLHQSQPDGYTQGVADTKLLEWKAKVGFSNHHTSQHLQVHSYAAPCRLRQLRNSREPTLVMRYSALKGTATKRDLGFEWTLLDPNTNKPLVDIANNAGESNIFAKTDYFIRLSKDDSDELHNEDCVAWLVLVQHHEVVRDSKEHNVWLDDMVSCLVLINKQPLDQPWKRIGAVLLKRHVFEAHEPQMQDIIVA